MASVLKHEHGQEAIAIGRMIVSKETMQMLCNWADVIVVMQPHMQQSVPEDFHHKVRCIDVGEDRFGIYIHPELLPMVRNGAHWLLGTAQ